uniref:Aspartate aminotransferase n=1 Tax=Solanum tuberosum TaxID=4113 RepID=M1CPA1_SOLTU
MDLAPSTTQNLFADIYWINLKLRLSPGMHLGMTHVSVSPMQHRFRPCRQLWRESRKH